MTPAPVPPPLAETLLRLSIRDREWREAVLGDLREEQAAVQAARGAGAARRWYWRQAMPLAARFAASRVVPAWRPARRRLAVADLERTSTLGAGWSREWRHAWRSLAQRPGLSAVVVGTLAVALAANAVIFSLADALYLRPFRFPDVHQLLLVSSDTSLDSPYLDRESVAPADFADWRVSATTLSGMAAAEFWDPNLSGVDVPEQLPGFRVTPGFFELLGATPVAGRTFTEAEGRAEAGRVVVISHAAWQRRFGGDPGIVGRTMRLEGEPYEVVGVMPPRFAIPYGADVWAPLALTDAAWADRTGGNLMVFGRLAAGRSLDEARDELRAIAARQAAEYPTTNRARGVTVMSFARGLGDEAIGPFLAIWQGAALLLLLVACANIANLLLARATERQPEIDIRLALGAGRARLVLQLLIEGACLATLGVAAGSGLAFVAMRTSRDILPASVVRFVPGYEYLRLDVTALGVMAALGAAATIVFALVPALQATRQAGGGPLTRGTRAMTASAGRQWLRSALAGAQVALCLALVVAAALIVGGVRRAANGAMGFDKQQLLTAELTLAERPYATDAARRRFLQIALERLAAEPGVTVAAAASTVPYATGYASRPFEAEGTVVTDGRDETRTTDFVRVTPGYFAAMRIPLVAGRDLTDGDGPDALPVAVVSRALVERFFGDADPIGRRFRLGPGEPWITVSGVVDDVIQDWISGQRRPTVYRPMAQDPTLGVTLLARTAVAPTMLASGLRRAVAAADPDQPILLLRPMTAVVSDRLAGLDYFADVLTVMSGIALVLALAGMYSLMTYLAARRTREVGVRLALGASTAQVTWLGLSRALVITAGGLAAGGVCALALGRVMQTSLFGLVQPDARVIGTLVAGLAVVAVAAGYLPARKAAGLDPWQALRTE